MQGNEMSPPQQPEAASLDEPCSIFQYNSVIQFWLQQLPWGHPELYF